MRVPLERGNAYIGASWEHRNVHVFSCERRNVHNGWSHVDGRGHPDGRSEL